MISNECDRKMNDTMVAITTRRTPSPLVVLAVTVLLASLPGCTSTAPPARPAAPVVLAGGEQLEGAFIGGGTTEAVFLGVPYAAPPVGDLRWRPPAPATPRPGLQRATAFAPPCMQTPNGSFYRHIAKTLGHDDPVVVSSVKPPSEDCLHLNVWTGNLGGRNLQPVMVWIHGGGNVAGTPAAVQTDGANLSRKGVVVVSFGYRLNVFGFLAHPALTAESEHRSSGNYALLDQIAALRWVRQNIAAFGGDPNRVTIFGESAGATNITYLLATPQARGLFHRAVIQSGGYAASDFRPLAEAEAGGKAFSDALPGAESQDVLSVMRAMPAEAIHRAWMASQVKGVSANAPNVDGWVLPQPAGIAFEQGKHSHVPLLVGFNRDEWTTLRPYWPNVTVDAFRSVLRTIYGSLGDRALELYPATTNDEAVLAADRWQTDWYFACPSRFVADRMARAGDRVYFYVFSRAVQAPGGDQLGAYHGAEIPYVWDTLASETWVARQPHDLEIARRMSDAWVRFATTGDPNGGASPAWPLYDRVGDRYLEFGDAIRVQSGIRQDACRVYEDLQALRIAGGH